MKSYRFSSYRSFSEKEIDQLCNLVMHSGQFKSIDRRKYTKNVLDWALHWSLIYDGKEKRWKEDVPGKLYISTRFDVQDLPVYALWKLVEPIIGDRKGYSIGMQQAWLELNIYPIEHKFHARRDYEAIFSIMCKLSQYHFINFQCGGSVWWVDKLDEDKWITDQF